MSREVRTFCRICEPACGLIAEVESGEVRLKPDREHPVHKGFCCHKGLAFGDIHADPDRVNYPLKRRNSRSETAGDFERVSWDGALNDIGETLRAILEEHGPEAIAIYRGNPTALDSRGALAGDALGAQIGTPKTFTPITQDCSNKFACSELVYGTALLHPIPDLENTDYFLCIGSNPRVSHMTLVSTTDPMRLMKEITQRGGKVRFVNPRHIESASKSGDDLVQIKPDTDVYFLAAVIDEIRKSIGFDEAFLTQHAAKVDGLIDFVSQYPVKRVAPIVGLDEDEIRTVAKDFAQARSASIYMSTGANMGRQGTLAYWLVQMLSAVTGNLGVKGGNLYSPGVFPTAPFGIPRKADPFFETPAGRLRHCLGALPGNMFAECLTQPQSPTKALIVLGGNPLLAMSAEERNREVLASLDLIVSIDLYRNATGEMADFILPAADWLEREDVNTFSVGFQTHPYVQYTPAVVDPVGERKPDWWIYSSLLKAVGLPSILDGEDPNSWHSVSRMLQPAGLSIDELKAMETQVVVLPPTEPEQIFTHGIQTKDGKINCCPVQFSEAIDACADIFDELDAEPEDSFKLIGRRTMYMHNGWLHNMTKLKRASQLTNPLYINPDDARRLDLGDGEEAVISNTFGSITTPIQYDETLRSGVVAMTHSWGNTRTPGMRVANAHPGVNVNQLLPRGPGSYEKLSNMSFMTGVPVCTQKRKQAG